MKKSSEKLMQLLAIRNLEELKAFTPTESQKAQIMALEAIGIDTGHALMEMMEYFTKLAKGENYIFTLHSGGKSVVVTKESGGRPIYLPLSFFNFCKNHPDKLVIAASPVLASSQIFPANSAASANTQAVGGGK